MRIVKLSDLSDKERKRVLEEQQVRVEANRQASEQNRINANNQFNSTWDRVKNIANNNLNRSNNMQNMIDRNTRNQMAKTMEDYTNTKRIAMQKASSYVQEKAKQQPIEEEKSTWDKIKEKLQFGMGSNRVPIYKDSSGKVDENKTAMAIAQQNFEADKQKMQMMESKKVYEKAINEQLKNTLSYKEVQRQNPNATEEELLKITKEKDKNASQEFIESLANMETAERNARIEGFTHNKNQKYALKSQVQAVETQKEADRINQDIQNGNYWSSIGHVARGLPEGAMNAVIKTTTALESLSGQKSPSFVSHNIDPVKEAELQTRKYQEITSKIDNGIVQTGSGVTNTIGEMAPSMVTNIVAPGYGAVVNAMNVGSSSYLDALNEDGTNKGQALLTGALKATASYGIEKIAGGNFLSEGSLDDWAVKTIASKTSSKAGRKIASMIYNVGGEVLEEELENQVDYLIDATINDKGITLKEWLDEQGETVKNTALTQLTLGLFGLGGDTYKKTKEYSLDSEAKKWINEAQKIIDKENLQIDTEKMKDRELRNVLNQVNVKENNQIDDTKNLQQNAIQNQNNAQTGQINQSENKMPQNENMEQIDSQKIIQQQKEQRLQELRNIDTSKMGLLERSKIKNEIKALEQGYNSVEEYREAERLKVEKVKQEYEQKQKNKLIKNTENSDYKMQHRPTKSGIGYDITSTESIGKDFYTNPERYVDMSKIYNQESYQAIKSIQGNPEVEITVYRASPVNELNNGDWISLSKEYATMEAQKENVKVNEFKVKAKDIQWAGDDINEFGYFPTNLANNSQTVYNNTESEGGINGQSQFTNKREATNQSINERGMVRDVEEIGNNERGRSTSIIDNTKGENDGSRVRQDNISKEGQSIELAYKDNKNILKTMEYAKKNPYVIPSKEIQEVRNFAEELGIPLNIYSGEEGNIHIGLTDGKEVYLDINQKNVSKEDGSIMSRFSHELLHFVKRNNKTNAKDSINELTSRIVKENPESIKKLVENKGYDTNEISNKAFSFLAEEVLGDYSAKHISGYDIDYSLPEDIAYTLNTTIDDAITELKLKNTNNVQEETITSNPLNKVEVNTQSLGYKSDTEGKQRKHYKSVMESEQVGEVGKQSAKILLENDTYKPLSNIDTLATANENINKNGVDNTYIAFRSKLNSNERITLQDIATGERLIQIFSQSGDFDKVNGLIQDVAMLGTELGQQVQAMSLIKKMSPEGQLMYLNKMVDRINLKENVDLKVSDDMSKRILETKNETELDNVMTDIAVELGEQLPVSMGDKVRSWRYLSMLGNPKTHIKNLGANVAMNVTQQTKNKLAGAMEGIVGIFNKDMERTKTLRHANKDQRNFAKQDAEFMKDKIDGGGKYDVKNAIQSNKKQFENKVLNAISNFNSNMLELEDNIFLKKAYKQALQNYMSANKLTSTDMQNSSVLQKAREYASYQAQEATFHQFSELARRLTEIENKGGIAGKVLEAVIPFKKTPINIAKSGVEYSPIGLAKSLTYDIAQLNKKTKDYKAKLDKGLISEAEYKTGTSKLVTKTIDDMAKGLTGTSLALLGYALKDMGILKSGNDGDDDEFKEKLGEQEYAIRIGDSTYTLDWVSPSAIPMFIGATVHDLTHSEKEDNSNVLNSLLTSSAKALEPMTEMSMLQGLTSAISSYEQGSSNMLFDLGASAVSSYLGQFVPTSLGQVAKTIDDKERDTSSTEKGIAKKVDQFKKQQMAKIPMVSKMLPVKKDVWGNEKTRDSNPLMRAYEVGLAPYNRKKVVEDYTENKLLKVFEDTGEKSILPGIPNKDITINKQKYRVTAGEYNKAKETFGKTSKAMLDGLVKSKDYKSLTDEQKAEAINNIYSYAKEKIKVDYAKSKKQEIETTPFYNVLKELNSPSNQSEFLSYSSKIKGIEKDKEKKQILFDGNYSLETKSIIYKNTLGKEDELYNNVLGKSNININEYLKYKLQEFESDKEYDGTKNGKTISGSKKKKVSAYVDNMNITRVQKLAILGTQYKLKRVEQEQLYNYLEKLPMKSQAERLDVFSKYSSNFVIYEDNTMDFK